MSDTDAGNTATDLTMPEKVKPVQSEVVAFDYELIKPEHRAVIEARTQAIKERIRRTAQAIVEIGEMLSDVKSRLPHGQFTLWLEVEFSWDIRSAQRFMAVSAMFKNDINVVFPKDLLSKVSIEQSALYILAAKSTPADVRRKILERAYNGEPFTTSKVKQIVTQQKAKRSTNKKQPSTKTEKLAASAAVLLPKEDFCLGDWIEVRQPNAWAGKQGEVLNVGKHEMTVRLNNHKKQILRFYPEELIKVLPFEQSAPTDKSFYSAGDMVVIDCPPKVDCDYKHYNGSWAIIDSIGTSGNVRVHLAGKIMSVKNSDVEPIDSPTAVLEEVAQKVNQLLGLEELDDMDRRSLDFLLRQQIFTPKQLRRVDQIWNDYFGTKET